MITLATGRVCSRVDGLWRAAWAASSFSGRHFQCFHCRGPRYLIKMGGGIEKDKKKKGRNFVATWEPLSEQSLFFQGRLDNKSKAIISVGSESFSHFKTPQNEAVVVLSETVATDMDSKNAIVLDSAESIHQENNVSALVEDLCVDSSTKIISEPKTFSVSIQVDKSLIRFVKGRDNSTQREIEEETGATIVFTFSKGQNYIVLEGTSSECVNEASERVMTVIEQAVKSPSLDYSHFISLPLAIHPNLVKKLYDFQNTVLGNDISGQEETSESESNEDDADKGDGDSQLLGQNVPVKLEIQDVKKADKVKTDALNTDGDGGAATRPSRSSLLAALGIERSIFIKPKTFHLTILMLKLWNEQHVSCAAEVLQSVSSDVLDALDHRPVYISLKGLECMRGLPAKARVVYAPLEEIGGEGRLLRACQVIIDAYTKAGLVLEKDAQYPLKLHATLMNARHRKRKPKGKGNKARDNFDARSVFRRFGTENWGEYLIQEAHLSKRFMFDESGYYHCSSSISLNKEDNPTRPTVTRHETGPVLEL